MQPVKIHLPTSNGIISALLARIVLFHLFDACRTMAVYKSEM